MNLKRVSDWKSTDQFSGSWRAKLFLGRLPVNGDPAGRGAEQTEKMALYIWRASRNLSGSMFAFDTNIWDLLAMPFGVVICFGPALCVWVWKELRGEAPAPNAPEERPDPHRR
jgi:hypothetical protein